MTFFNIFSKEKEEENTLKIIVDNREKNSLVPSELINIGFKVEFKNLPVADYLIDNVAIERKTISDLKSSIINKRIFSQMQELQQYPSYLLIIEGISEEDIYAGIIHENALRGFMISAALDYRIPIIFTKNEKDTVKYLSVLANKKGDKAISLRASKIMLSKEEKIQFILEGFPHIGPMKAKALLKKFGSIKDIINASEQELKEILGKRGSDFRDLIN